VVCTASDPCHDPGVCDTGTGVCSNPAKARGSACNDGNACTQSDQCDEAGACVGTNTVPPEVGNTLLVDKAGTDAAISWDAEGIPGPFHVYRGFRQPGLPIAYNQGCLEGPIPGTTATDTQVQPASQSRSEAHCAKSCVLVGGLEHPRVAAITRL
jgi:hypothetical protein